MPGEGADPRIAGASGAEERARRAAVRAAILNPSQLVPLVVVPLLVLGQRGGFIADVPVWQLVGSLLFAQVGSSLAFAIWPSGSPHWQTVLRVGVMIASIGVVLYLIGWGATLAIGFVFGAAEVIRVEGSWVARSAIAWTVAVVAVGQIAVATGRVSSFLPEPEVHGLAVLATVGTCLIIALLGWTTAQKEEVEGSLRQSEERFRALVQHASDVVLVLDRDGAVRYVSPAAERVLGYRESDLNQIGPGLVHEDDWGRVNRFFDSMIEQPGQVAWIEMRLRHADGGWRCFEVGVTNRLDDPNVGGMVCNLRDVTERRLFEDQLSHQAYHDPLTLLPNRTSFLERLEHALERSREHHAALAILFLDLDRFKLVNDSLGHEVGDRLLTDVAERLRGCLRPGDSVARFGGDEFTLLLEDVSDVTDAIGVAERITQALRDPFTVEEHPVTVSTSIGIAVSRRGADRAGELLREADLAMYVAKERGSNWEVFDARTAPHVAERLELEGDLWRALDRGELVVLFQPEVELATGRVVGAEALVRWQHPRRGLLEPAAFVPYAEDSGLIVAIDRFVLGEACRWARTWAEERGPERPVVSVNLSPRFVRQPQAVLEVGEVLNESGADPRYVQVEITERTPLLDLERTVDALHRLRAIGMLVAIDDFGTGYSSLESLRRLPIDVVKLDRTFVDAMDRGDGDLAIVHAVVTMGHALGMRVTAEGVERAVQVDRLREFRCDSAMGWYWAKALPPDELDPLLRDGFPIDDIEALVVPLRRGAS